MCIDVRRTGQGRGGGGGTLILPRRSKARGSESDATTRADVRPGKWRRKKKGVRQAAAPDVNDEDVEGVDDVQRGGQSAIRRCQARPADDAPCPDDDEGAWRAARSSRSTSRCA